MPNLTKCPSIKFARLPIKKMTSLICAVNTQTCPFFNYERSAEWDNVGLKPEGHEFESSQNLYCVQVSLSKTLNSMLASPPMSLSLQVGS
jgi:hypothetical protein